MSSVKSFIKKLNSEFSKIMFQTLLHLPFKGRTVLELTNTLNI